jgi:tmRNA-binding protein
MQYSRDGQQQVSWITPEEWLMLQDLPYKELFLERRGIERLNNAVEDVAQTLATYSKLYENGMNPEDAVLATAKSLQDKRNGIVQPESPLPVSGAENPMGAAGMGAMM